MSENAPDLNDDGQPVIDDDTDTVDTDSEEWTPPTREAYEELVAKHKKATAEAVKRKKMLRENGIDIATGKRADNSDSPTDDADKVSKTDFDTAISQAKSRALSLAFELPTALAESGWNGSKRLMRHLDLDAVEIDEDGVTGLSEQLAELKEEFPEFFKRNRANTPSAKDVGGGKKQPESGANTDWTDQLRKNVFGS